MIIRKGILKRISKTDKSGPTRTEDIECSFTSLPIAGRSFECWGKPLDTTKNYRLWSTSRVVEVHNDPKLTLFKTETGSSYSLEIKGD